MTQYINKSAVVAEIEKRIKELQDLSKENEKKLDSFQKIAINLCIDECKVVLNILDTLEVKEVDLEKEIDNFWNPRFNLGWDGKSLLTMNHTGFATIAEHFFELGLKTQRAK